MEILYVSGVLPVKTVGLFTLSSTSSFSQTGRRESGLEVPRPKRATAYTQLGERHQLPRAPPKSLLIRGTLILGFALIVHPQPSSPLSTNLVGVSQKPLTTALSESVICTIDR